MGNNLNPYKSDDDSLTQSYNQKVKDDTNFLIKSKNVAYDDAANNDNDSNYKNRNNSDAYNLNTR